MNKSFMLSFIGSIFIVFLLLSCSMMERKEAKSKEDSGSKRWIASRKTVPFWKVEGGNQIFYMLGTAHMGVSLEELQCSKIIKDKIKESFLLFVETFTPGTESIYNNYEDSMRKLYLGSKKEMRDIIGQFSQDIKENMQDRMYFVRAMFTKDLMERMINMNNKLVEDNGQFRYLSKESQEFLIQNDLYNEHKSYLDYYMDVLFRAQYDVLFSQRKYLDADIVKLALDHNISIENLDRNKTLITDLEKELEELYKAESGGTKLKSADVDAIIANYEYFRLLFSEDVMQTVFEYKSINWKNATEGFGSFIIKMKSFIFGSSKDFFKNRNEAWMGNILSVENQDQAVFIAAGYGRFTDPYNILGLLKNEDFEVTLIDSENCRF